MKPVACLCLSIAIVASPVRAGAPEGFTPLFNGKDLTGWKATGDMKVWGAEKGAIFCRGAKGGWLLTEKEYAATVRLGVSTTTDDAEGEVVVTTSTDELTEEAVRAAFAAQVGELEQVPSAVSAIKVDGKRAYRRVREGEDVELPARRVTVHELDVTAVRLAAEASEADIRVRQHPMRELMGRTFNTMVRTLVLGGIRDTQCGFKLFTRAAAHDLFGRATVDGFAFDVEVLWLAQGKYRVAEVPVVWRHVEESKVSPGVDAARMFVDLVRLRLRHGRR